MRKIWLALGIPVAVIAGGVGFLAVTGTALPMPGWVLAKAEARANRALQAAGTVGAEVSIGDARLVIDRRLMPRLRLYDLRLLEASGTPMLILPELRVAFDRPDPWDLVPRPRLVLLSGARLFARRQEDGSFDLAFGVNPGGTRIDSYSAAMAEIDRLFTLPALSSLQRVEAEDLTLTVQDARALRTWELDEGALKIEVRDADIEAGLSARVHGSEEGRIGLTFLTQRGSTETRMTAMVEDIAAADIAEQAAPLAPLAVLDASVSGQVTAGVDAGGVLSQFAASLNLGPGALSPTEDTLPIAFDAASMALTYDPSAQKVSLVDLTVDSKTLRVKATGHSYLKDLRGGLPETVIGQIRFADISVDPEGLFTEPVRFSGGWLDARLRLNPFTVDIGQLALAEGDRHLRGHGHVQAAPGGWRVAFDTALNEIERSDLLALWPVALVPRTREWLSENVLEADLRNVDAAIRLDPGQEPKLSLGYEFDGAEARFLRTLPPIEDGRGYASIDRDRYSMTLERGRVMPPEGGLVDAADSVFLVRDIRQKPTMAEIRLRTRSSVTAALSLLDQPPFGFMTKAGRSVHVGTGEAEVAATLHVPLVRGIKVDQVDFDVAGTIRDFSSDVLVPGRTLASDALQLTAGPDRLRIGGPGRLGQVGFDGAYELSLKREDQGRAFVEGNVVLSEAAVEEFRLGLPAGMISGQGLGQARIDLAKGVPPELALSSDLRGVGVSLPAIGWQKAAGAAGRLVVGATLSDPPAVQRLEVEGGGMTASGSVSLTDAGLDAARFDRVRLNGWLDAPVTLSGRGQGRSPQVNVNGGRIDLRQLKLDASGSGGGGDPTPVRLRLDELRIGEKLALTGVSGDFNTQGGFNGRFAGLVNGGAPVNGIVGPVKGGTGVKLTAADAGQVLASAGLFPNARGGALDVVLEPEGRDGYYRGRARANGVRVQNVPVLAALLNAVSVVGLLEQLNGSGILFQNVDAEFRLTPAAIEVTRGAAVGASLGVSLAGVYGMADKRFMMQGVISPIYLLNGIGELVSQRGEGLFGFNYRLSGTADDPQVSVNPLSLLTPGAFREIFRNPPPRLAE
ncbi:DUF3971 domain-containing protein [Cereibacter sp. SYSU M97828]|nr:DUF3971 domain-containing protein [Cereibacter flavus]